MEIWGSYPKSVGVGGRRQRILVLGNKNIKLISHLRVKDTGWGGRGNGEIDLFQGDGG